MTTGYACSLKQRPRPSINGSDPAPLLAALRRAERTARRAREILGHGPWPRQISSYDNRRIKAIHKEFLNNDWARVQRALRVLLAAGGTTAEEHSYSHIDFWWQGRQVLTEDWQQKLAAWESERSVSKPKMTGAQALLALQALMNGPYENEGARSLP